MAATARREVPRESPVQIVDLHDLMQTRRTEALPKQSLFGSTLEKFDKDAMDKIKSADLKKYKKHQLHIQRAGRFQLPEPFRSQFKARGQQVLSKTKEDIEKQKEDIERTNKVIESMETDAFQFNIDKIKSQAPSTVRTSEPVVSSEALKAAKDMNYVGLNERNSYNRDKYGNRPPVHQYSLIGDVMRPGMDVMSRNKTEMAFPTRSKDRNIFEARESREPRHSSARMHSGPYSVLELPPNIRHQFGSIVCDSLLSDRKLVDKTITEQKELKEQLKRRSKTLSVPELSRDLKPEYDMLGNAMRQNVFPGYTINHKLSTMKTSYTDSVHLRRYPQPDQWRYQRDELSTWAEHNIIMERMRKKWREYEQSRPQVTRNWERGSFTRPVPKPVTSPPKPMPKKKKVAKPVKVEEKPFEDVIFETPPVTPPPEQIKLAPKAERDDEFWNMYDKGIS